MPIRPTPNRPIVAWRPRGGQMPVPLNPIQSLRLADRLPDALSLAERGYYRGIHGLGAYNAEVAMEGAVLPRRATGEPLGELGFLPAALIAVLAPLVAKGVETFVDNLAAKGAEKLLNGGDGVAADMEAARRLLAQGGMSEKLAGVDGELVERLALASLAGAEHPDVGELGIFGFLSRRKKEAASGGSAKEPAGKSPKREGWIRKLIEGTKTGARLVTIGKDLLAIRKKISKEGKRINPREGMKLIQSLVRNVNQMLGDPGEPVVMSTLAGVGGALKALDAGDLSHVVRRRQLGWRPTLGEYALGCCCQRMRSSDFEPLMRGVNARLFDADPQAAQAQAMQMHGLPMNAQLSEAQLGQLGASTDLLQALANGAANIFSDLARSPVEKSVVEGARQVLGNLIGATQDARSLQAQVSQVEQQLTDHSDAIGRLQSPQYTSSSVPTQLAVAQKLDELRLAEQRLRKLLDDSTAALEQKNREIAELRKQAAPVAAIVREQQQRAEAAEGQRIEQVERLTEAGLLRGQVMVLSRQEYADLLRRTNEAEAGRRELQMLAEQGEKQRKADAALIADLNIQIVQLKQKLADLHEQSRQRQQDAEISAAIEGQRRQLQAQLDQREAQFRAELDRVRQTTAALVDRAGDVVNRTGIQMIFDLFRQLTGTMRDVRDVTQAGEFLRFFPEVLQQLKLAQDITRQAPPVVNVAPPNVNVQPPNVNVQPPNVNVAPPTFVIGPGLDVRKADATTPASAISNLATQVV